jgi:central kinetochore subunit Mal2/MCM21
MTNTLLSSTVIQNQLKNNSHNQDALTNSPPDIPVDENPLSTSSSPTTATSSDTTTHLTNMHRLSFTVTTFPFTDPSPNSNQHLHGRLLGIRLDHCSRHGTFQKPFYILLRRVEEGGDEWRVHRHTIPPFVGVGRLEEEFLPLRDGDEDDIVRAENRKQDLHSFVRKVRHELICWELRKQAIEILKEELRLTPNPHTNDDIDEELTDDDDDDDASDPDTQAPKGLYGIQSIEETAFEARQARITWTDGTIARIKISNKGLIERAVVVGESGRIKGVENLLVDGESRIEELVGKLRVLVGGSS